MEKGAGKFQKRCLLFILVLLVFPLTFRTVTHSEEVLFAREGKEGHPRMDSSLFELQKRHLLQGRDASRSFAQQQDLRMDGLNQVTVLIQPKAGETKESIDIEALKAYGVEVLKSGHSVVKAKVPIDLLDFIADHVKGVNFLRRPDRPRANVVSEGVNLTGASPYHASGYTGQNVKVAIIDLEFGGLSEAISAGALPPTVVKIDCTGAGCASTDFSSEDPAYAHGTAVAEIVYEMAPGAQLYLMKVGDNLDLMDAKDYCIANGIKIINHSVGWYISNFYDGTCYFDNAVCAADHAYRNGILWANAAGNDARSHYQATFNDTDGDRLHNVTETDNFISLYAFEGDPIIALLTWDAWPATDQDYDLLLFNSAMKLVDYSTGWQTGTQPPQEGIFYTVPASGVYYLAVKNARATSSHRFSIFNFYQDLNPYIASSSLVSPADATGVMAVAAINSTQWLTGPQEYFSSQGPTNDGRVKPEISGPDGVYSFIYTPLYGSFQGTSAASPHVAGAAALILSNSPAFTVSQLWDTLVSSAIGLGTSGQNPIFGYGRLNLSTLSVDPVFIDFGDVILGTSLERAITIQNIGGQNLTIGTITAPATPYSLVSDSCSGKSLPLGGTCTFNVRFSPKTLGSFNGAIPIPSNDPFEKTFSVSLTGKGVGLINLLSPIDPLSVNPCSINVPPLFQWDARASFARYQIQFSWDPAFGVVSVNLKASGDNHVYNMGPFQWKKVLSVPGAQGGKVYWRVIGIKPDGASVISNQGSILVPPPQSVGGAVISPVSRNKLPVLSWQNRCNVRFRVWFGSDPGFFLKTTLSFYASNPNLNGGIFSRELTSEQWQRIRRLGGDRPGSTIYWFVESRDSLNRLTTTEILSFTLTD